MSTVQPSFKTYKYATPPRRLILSIEGLEREGKTHLALNAPGPLGYMQFDPGGDDVVPKVQLIDPKKVLHVAKYKLELSSRMSDSQKAELAKQVWLQTLADYEHAVKHMRSLVVDTATEWFTLLRIAAFGKLTQVMPEQYGPVYAEWRRVIRLAYDNKCNLILLHKLKEEYIDGGQTTDGKRKAGKKTGNLVRDGFKGIAYEVQLCVRAYRDEERNFWLRVENCRQNPEIDGFEMPVDKETGFADLAQMVYPDSDAKDWQ